MKKALLVATIIIVYTASAQAQTRPRYALDDFSSGTVRVKPSAGITVSPERVPIKPLVKKTVQKTARTAQTLGARDSYALAETSHAVSHLPGKYSHGAGVSLRGNSTGSAEVDGYILDSCARYRVDPLLIFAQMNQESSFKLRATSYKGASGLMQLMPATAARFGVTDIYDPQQNIEGGVKYMRWLLDTFNQDISLALAGYNAGEGAVMKYGWAIPPYNETQDYVRRISARYEILRGSDIPRAGAARPYAARSYTPPAAAAPVEKKKPAVTLSKYENPVYAVRTADGRMQLVNRR